jgi:ATP-dependent helicase/DNAse subunit B
MKTLKRFKPRPHVLTNTALGRMRACERKYYLRNVAGLKSRYRSAALGIGSAFHAGIEHQSVEAAEACLRGEEV